MLSFLSNGWVGNVIGLIGIAVGYCLYRKSLRIPEPRITIQADHALTWNDNQELPPGFDIKFNGASIPRVARSVVRLWNGGTGCLRKELVPSHDPLRLVLEKDGCFLSTALLNCTNPSNKCDVRISLENPSEALISFEFLDANDGCSIGLLHTASRATPTLKGSVMGYKFKVIEAAPRKPRKGFMRWFRPLSMFWLPLLIGLFALVTGLLSNEEIVYAKDLLGFGVDVESRPRGLAGRISTLLVGTLYLAIAIYYYWHNRRIYPKNLRIHRKDEA